MNYLKFCLFSSFLLISVVGRSQCTPLFTDTLAISDRYSDLAVHGNLLILANAYGLTLRELDHPEADPLEVLPVSGEVTRVLVQGTRLYVVSKGAGFHIFELPPAVGSLQYLGYQALPDLVNLVAANGFVFADTGRNVVMLAEGLNSEYQVIGKLPVKPLKLAVSGSQLLVHRSDFRLETYSFGANGFGTSRKITVDDQDVFYGFDLNNDLLVLDALDGVRWLNLSANGAPLDSGFFYDNKDNSGLVLESRVAGNLLYLRFTERMDILRIDGQRRPHFQDSIAMPFQEMTSTLIRPVEDRLFLLNTAAGKRSWTLTIHRFVEGSAPKTSLIAAKGEDVTGAALIGENLYLATAHEIRLAGPGDNPRDLLSLPVIYRYDGAISEMVGSDTMLFVISSEPEKAMSRIDGFRTAADGGLQIAVTRNHSGSLSNLTQYQDQAAYLQFFRTARGDHYRGHYLARQGLELVPYSLGSEEPVTRNNLFRSFQISELGLSYHNGEFITLIQRLEKPTASYRLSPEEPIQNIASSDGVLWVETASGVSVYRIQNREGKLAWYPQWFNLSLLKDNKLLVQNRKDIVPSNFHLVSMDENSGSAVALMSFATSTAPLIIAPRPGEIFLPERTALNFYQFQCPDQENVYLVPFTAGAELTLSTAIEENNLITMRIYNSENLLIGVQRLTSQMVGSLNGRPLTEWLIDFNSLDRPHAVTLMSSNYLAPVLSGTVVEGEASRWAYRIPPLNGSDVYVPHIPRNLENWAAGLYLRTAVVGGQEAIFDIESANGNRQQRTAPIADTNLIDFANEQLLSSSSWLKLSGELGVYLSGFSLIQYPSLQQAAAVPLVAELSDFLLVPFLYRNQGHQQGWTGLVLANPNKSDATLRITGYDNDGSMILDRSLDLASGQSLVQIAEELLTSDTLSKNVQWLALFSTQPVMGMMLFGDTAEESMAGLPLSSQCGTQLIYPAIRNNRDWWTSIVVTNLNAEAVGLEIEALNGTGTVTATTAYELSAKGSQTFSLDELFPKLSPYSRAGIQTLRVRSSRNIMGSMLRGQRNSKSLEAVSAQVLD